MTLGTVKLETIQDVSLYLHRHRAELVALAASLHGGGRLPEETADALSAEVEALRELVDEGLDAIGAGVVSNVEEWGAWDAARGLSAGFAGLCVSVLSAMFEAIEGGKEHAEA